ncbi:MAG TPA: phosphoribosyltransferase, partial [Marinilabiliaceae bacterium]|nr:phosphoribosyltransferase [Marinilabiliaceae bacterium]
AIINQRLNIEFNLLKINLRDPFQKPKFDSPKLLEPIDFEFKSKKILLVEDRIKTGATVNLALNLLKDAALIKTFAVNGEADYALYNETCFRFPWII